MTTSSELRLEMQDRVQSIRSNRAYTDEAKRVLLARAYVDHRREMEALRIKALHDVEQERSRLTRELFGLNALARAGESRVSLAVSQRDARDRVAAVSTEDEARELLVRAEQSGDDVLARAVLERSVEQTRLAPLNAYIEVHPAAEAKLQRLVDLRAVPTGRAQIQFEMEHALDKPQELQGLSDYQLEWLAEWQIDHAKPAGTKTRPATASPAGGAA